MSMFYPGVPSRTLLCRTTAHPLTRSLYFQLTPWPDPGRHCPALKCLAFKSLEIEGSIQKLLQRHQVSVPVSCGWCGCWVTANIPYGPCSTQDGHEARADVVIVAHVLVFLLAPHQLCTWVLLCLLLDQVKGEWRDLGQTGRKGSVARGRETTKLLLQAQDLALPGTLPRAMGLAI